MYSPLVVRNSAMQQRRDVCYAPPGIISNSGSGGGGVLVLLMNKCKKLTSLKLGVRTTW